MRISKEILNKTSKEIAGEEAFKIVEYLKDKENISEFKIAKDVKIEIHHVRNLLYKLHNHYLATYIRKKDRQKGWYISYWTLNHKRFKEVYAELQKNRLIMLKEKLKKEQEYREGLYMCPNLCTRQPFDKAMDMNFTCPECGRILNPQDNTKTIEHLKEMIEQMEVGA